ncbi:hypothetical protein [Ekhidna sp.]|uniref:hypothetical protein n=1 Tax=Ekhidna sp. TaxID=2608089 RepID=UPI003B50FA52
MKLAVLVITYLAITITSCDENLSNNEISKIEFGTSFGICAGYCTQIVTISEGIATKTIKPQLSQNLEEKTCSIKYAEFESLAGDVDVASFMELEEIIGCPDCADGGSEWIELTTPQGTKKVTYEYGKEPAAVKSIIEELRKQYDLLGECE